MWIEIIGLPGVGKTTLIESNKPQIEAQYKIIRSDAPSFLQKIAARVMYHCVYSPALKDKSLAKKLAYRQGFRVFEHKKLDIFFYDSGMLQVIIENLIESNFEDRAEKMQLLSKIKCTDKVLYFKDSIKDIATRETGRDHPRFSLSLSETIHRYEKAQDLIEKDILQNIEFIDIITPHQKADFKKALNI